MKDDFDRVNEEYLKAHNPCWVTYLSPFKLIVPDNEEPLKVDLKEINANTYNHSKLCRIIDSIEIVSFDHKMLVCYDGAFAIPKIGKFAEKEAAVDYFNNFFGELLLGGCYCEGIDRRDVVNGSLHEKRLIWPVDFGNSVLTHVRSRLRMRLAGNIDSIILLNPKFIKLTDFHKFLTCGQKVLSKIINLTPKFLIRGITEITYRNWDLVLANLWITVEQLTDFIWHEKFLKHGPYHPSEVIAGRLSSLKEDNRTWSTSVKQEILLQTNLINEDIMSKIFPARKARNKLVHEGKSVPMEVAINLYQAVQLLIANATEHFVQDLMEIDVNSWESKMDKLSHNVTSFDEWKEIEKRLSIEKQ